MTKTVLNKTVTGILFCLFCTTAVQAQDIEKKYKSTTRGNESLYFIYPMNKYTSQGLPKDLEYDISYNSSEDSVSYNFTYYTQVALPLNTVSLVSEAKTATEKVNMFYINPQKKRWKHRASTRIAYADLVELYKQATPYTITLDGKEQQYSYTLSHKEWKKQAAIINKILQVIELNRK